MTAAHTPGPWQADGIAVRDSRGAQVALCRDQLETTKTHIVYVITGGEAEANARLIAAAPDLLRALGSLVMAIQFHDANTGLVVASGALTAPMQAAVEAITKADGGRA